MIENVPHLGWNNKNESQWFVILIDALYEAKTKLVISAIVPREDLFVGFDAAVDTHKGNEEIAIDDNNLGRERVIFG